MGAHVFDQGSLFNGSKVTGNTLERPLAGVAAHVADKVTLFV